MYPISPHLIDAVASLAATTRTVSKDYRAVIRTSLRAALDSQLSGFAHRVPVAKEAALILPKEQCDAILELIARVRQRRRVYEVWGLGSSTGRGLGVAALFSGPPGTGKTLAAGMIAEELQTDLYQVDMSKVVSKWIGETERNLATLFDAAEAGHAILLFDEADALFGRRTEVRTSNDRHANQETNYLLQRLESFRGICILTTNHDTAIDVAFRRRLAVHVHFPLPEVTERAALWRAMIGAAPTLGDLGLDDLALRYEMSGGHIRNAVMRAAFVAADADVPLTSQHLQRAAHVEYQALGRLTASP